ncbi:hypothetical protein TNIN_93151 [Trichonephila inaurata madagascariensis]|uniref:Uncharacterized protein n=1 Tax=Trichonephila inaurata madagascariensis TaxID=2747483 RepID=A0A8X6YFU0_9ARAC|nr:hypothetical protein TNIN_93151 [Trichonephila inaurata madagascariensis]
MSSSLTTDIRKCWTGFRATAPDRFRPSLDPEFRGERLDGKVSFFTPPSNRQMVGFQHFSSPFDALTCTLRLPDGGRGCAWDIRTHSIPLRDTEGCKPCHKPLKSIPEVAYIKSLLFRAV